jgi:large subunit ribosomal protein L6
MRRELFKQVKIPEGAEVEIAGAMFIVKGPEGENRREFDLEKIEIKQEGDIITVGNKNGSKKDKRRINTIAAHIKNMIDGVLKKFEYKLKVCFSHFPMTVEIKEDEILIKNFLGEKIPRKVIMPKNVEIELNKSDITLKSINKELVGQAAANFETATKIRSRDRRRFQDGIFITNKAGEEI